MELGTCFVREDILLRDGVHKIDELGRLGDFRSEEEIAWLEEHFMDFAREQYLVRWDDMREALKIVQRQKELQRQN